MSDRDILLRLCASLSLSDNTGDMWDNVATALKFAGFGDKDLGQLSELLGCGMPSKWFGRRGIPTLHGTDLSEEPDHA